MAIDRVYVVTNGPYDQRYVMAVFSSEEKAQVYIDSIHNEFIRDRAHCEVVDFDPDAMSPVAWAEFHERW